MPKPVKKITHTIDMIVHPPTSRGWIRIDGKIVYGCRRPDFPGMSILEIPEVVKALGGPPISAMLSAMDKAKVSTFVIDHPQFVKPYERPDARLV